MVKRFCVCFTTNVIFSGIQAIEYCSEYSVDFDTHYPVEYVTEQQLSRHANSEFWCSLWYKSKITWLVEKNAISHPVDMAKGCQEAYSLITSLYHIHFMGFSPLGRYSKGMSLGLWPLDIPMPYPPHGIMHSCPLAMLSCFYTTDCIKILN